MSIVRRMGTRFDNLRGYLFIVFYSYEVNMSHAYNMYMISMLDSMVDKHKGADRVK